MIKIENKIYNYIGIGFWIGAGVYSAINMLMNLKNIAHSHILNYNYIITGVAVIGLILNIILIKRKRKANSK
jgi:membrane protein DedA with SNARE-associated domain